MVYVCGLFGSEHTYCFHDYQILYENFNSAFKISSHFINFPLNMIWLASFAKPCDSNSTSRLSGSVLPPFLLLFWLHRLSKT